MAWISHSVNLDMRHCLLLLFLVPVPLLYPQFRSFIFFYTLLLLVWFRSFSEAFRRLGGMILILWYRLNTTCESGDGL